MTWKPSRILKSLPRVMAGVSLLSALCFAGTLVDKRDGTSYKTVKLGKQVWMAENLNFKTPGSKCFNGDDCATCGRFYRWKEAREICPDGWHLPVKGELDALLKLGPKNLQSANGFNLKVTGSFGGQDDVVYNADNSFIWSDTFVDECGEGDEGIIDCSYTYVLRNSHFGISIVEEFFDADVLYSVRCVKD